MKILKAAVDGFVLTSEYLCFMLGGAAALGLFAGALYLVYVCL